MLVFDKHSRRRVLHCHTTCPFYPMPKRNLPQQPMGYRAAHCCVHGCVRGRLRGCVRVDACVALYLRRHGVHIQELSTAVSRLGSNTRSLLLMFPSPFPDCVSGLWTPSARLAGQPMSRSLPLPPPQCWGTPMLPHSAFLGSQGAKLRSLCLPRRHFPT